MDNQVKKKQKTDDAHFNKHSVPVYIPERTNGHPGTVLSMCWDMMSRSNDKDVLAALYTSALGAFSAELLPELILALEKRSVNVRIVNIPADAEENGLNIAKYENKCSYEENLVKGALLFMLPFKRLNRNNFKRFFDNRKKALAGIVGLREKERDKMKFPLNFEKAMLIQESLAGNMECLQEICNYLMWAAEAYGKLQSAAGYVCEIINLL